MKRTMIMAAAAVALLAVSSMAGDVSGIKNLNKALNKPARKIAVKLSGKVCVVDLSENGNVMDTSEFGQLAANLFADHLSARKNDKFSLVSRYELVKIMRDSVIFGDSDTVGELSKKAGMDVLVSGDYSSQASDVAISLKAVEAKSGHILASETVIVKKTPDIEKMMQRKYRQFGAPTELSTAPISAAGEVQEMETGVYYEGGDGKLYPVREGMVLTSSDNYGVYFRPKRRCYVYVLQVDSSNKAARIFPNLEFNTPVNPVEGGREYWLPNDKEFFYLDSNPGREELFIFATAEPAPELENLKGAAGTVVEEVIRTMGIGGTRTSMVAAKVKDTSMGPMQLITRKLVARGDFYHHLSFIHR